MLPRFLFQSRSNPASPPSLPHSAFLSLPHLISTQILPRPRKRLPHPPRQFIPYQPSKHHNIFRLLHTSRDNFSAGASFEFLASDFLRFVAACDDGPDHDVADGAADGSGHEFKGLGFAADGGDVAVCVGGDDFGCCDGLAGLLVCVCDEGKDEITYVDDLSPVAGFELFAGFGELEEDFACVAVLSVDLVEVHGVAVI